MRLTLFNVEAETAVEALPRAVRAGVPSSEERAERNADAIPVPRGTDLETLHEAAEGAYPDHSLAIVADAYLGGGGGRPGQTPGNGGPWGGHHGPHGGPYGPGVGPGQGTGGGTARTPGGARGGRGSGANGVGGYGPGPGMGDPGGYGSGTYGPGMAGGCWGGVGGTLAPVTYLWHHATVPAELGFVVNSTGSFGFACTVYCGYGHPYMAERDRIVVTEGD